MPTQDDRLHPGQGLLSAFIADMLSPKVNELEAEGASLSPVKVVVLSPFDEITAEDPENPGSVCKVAFYKTHSKERLGGRISFPGAPQQWITGRLSEGSPPMKLPGQGIFEFAGNRSSTFNYPPAVLDADSLRKLLMLNNYNQMGPK